MHLFGKEVRVAAPEFKGSVAWRDARGDSEPAGGACGLEGIGASYSGPVFSF